jgi:hypothetical protein
MADLSSILGSTGIGGIGAAAGGTARARGHGLPRKRGVGIELIGAEVY